MASAIVAFMSVVYYNEQQAETLISENATYTFAVNGDMYVYAKFAEKEMYTFFAYPSEVGYFTENGQPVEFSESRRVEKGTQITLTANVREQGYKFAGWYIVNSYDEEKRFYSSNATETFTITDNTYIFAQFAEKESVTLTVIAGKHGNVFDNNAEGYSPPEKQLQFVVTEGSGVQVSASGETVYFKFVGWYDGEGETAALISDKDVYEFTVTDDAIGVDLPNRIKRHALLGGVTASRLIVCRCCRRSGCSTLEGVAVPCGDCRSQDQCDILGLCLTCRGVSAAVSVITDSVSFGYISPDGV